jgi:hypothetical protein
MALKIPKEPSPVPQYFEVDKCPTCHSTLCKQEDINAFRAAVQALKGYPTPIKVRVKDEI